MKVEKLSIPQVLLFTPKKYADERGWFMETFRTDILSDNGIEIEFVQDNQSFSLHRGTVRGLHFQLGPTAQGKLVRVLAGSILDVAVDLRRSSPSYGRHIAAILDDQTGQQLWIPPGFAHGFCTLEANTMIAYKVSSYYSKPHDRSLLWNDPALAIEWPIADGDATLSDKDKLAPRLAEVGACFD